MAPIDPKSTINSNLHEWAKASTDVVIKHKYRDVDPVLQEKIRKDFISLFVSGARQAMLALENNVPSGN